MKDPKKISAKAIVWSVVTLVIVVSGFHMASDAKKKYTSRLAQARQNGGYVPEEARYKYLTVGKQWVSIPGVGAGIPTGFCPMTPDVHWEVRVNKRDVYPELPINHPDYDPRNYGNGNDSIEVRIAKGPVPNMQVRYHH